MRTHLLATTVVDLAGRKAHWAKKFLVQHFLLIAPLALAAASGANAQTQIGPGLLGPQVVTFDEVAVIVGNTTVAASSGAAVQVGVGPGVLTIDPSLAPTGPVTLIANPNPAGVVGALAVLQGGSATANAMGGILNLQVGPGTPLANGTWGAISQSDPPTAHASVCSRRMTTPCLSRNFGRWRRKAFPST